MKPDTTVYRGVRPTEPGRDTDSSTPVYVTVDKEILSPAPSLKLRNHSPDGFNWGYSGSGPSQLALAILLDFTGEPAVALFRYHDFKFNTIGRLEQLEGWELKGADIRLWLERQQQVGRHYEPVPDEPPFEDLPDDKLTTADVKDGDA